jgi:hypothetical protein
VTFLSTLLIFVVALLVIIGWLLSVPLEIQIDIDSLSVKKARMRLYWLYGLVAFSPKGGKPGWSTERASPAKKEKNPPRPKQRQGGRFMLAMVNSKGFTGRMIKLAIDCLRVIDFRDSRLYCRFGLGNPADTGQCLGMITPLFILLHQSIIPAARLVPDFNEEVFIIRAGTRIRIIPLRYLFFLLQFLISPELWRGIRAGMEARKV